MVALPCPKAQKRDGEHSGHRRHAGDQGTGRQPPCRAGEGQGAGRVKALRAAVHQRAQQRRAQHAGERAEQKGYSQVLWLDGVERKYIEEVGAMNVMFKINGEIVTPMLSGSILPGITRKSCLEVLRDKGYKVSERLLSVDELAKAMEDGTLEEAWGCGTAAVVSPIGELCYKDTKFIINDGKIGEVTQMLYDTLTGIQWGKCEDKYGWTHLIDCQK